MERQRNINAGKEVIRNVQLLRGVSALLVIFVHLDKLLSLINLPPFGGGGVDIFFVISGFIMVHTTIDREVSPRSFIAERFARIVPPYWAVTLAVFGIALIAPSLLQATHANWADLFDSLGFIPFAKSNGLIEPVLFVGWSLNYEMFFYVLFAVCLAFPTRKSGYVAIIVCLLALVAGGVLMRPTEIVARFYTTPVILDFVFGIVLGILYRHLPNRSGLTARMITVFFAVLCLVSIIALPLVSPQVSGLFVCGLPAGLLVGCALLLERWGWTITSKLPLQLGAASFSIYLIHPFVTQIGQKVGLRLHLSAITAVAMLIATLVIACVFGMLVHRLLERPLSRATRHLLRVRRLNARIDSPVVRNAT